MTDQLSIIINRFRPIVDLNRIEIVATIDRTPKFGSKKSIRSGFEYDLDQILGGPWLDPISLQAGQYPPIHANNPQFLPNYWQRWLFATLEFQLMTNPFEFDLFIMWGVP